MNLQNIISNRENNEEESKTNTLENYMDNNINNIQKDEKDINNLNDEMNNNNKNDSNHDSNNDSNMIEKVLDNNINNNMEHNIENNIDNDNINNNDFVNFNKENNFNFNEKENNIIPENNNDKNNMNNKEKIKEKDIIDELIEKIRNNQDLGLPKEEPKKALEKLNEELKLGLEQLNQIKTNSNRKSILDTQNELEKKSFERNKKYNEVISELTKKIERPKNSACQYKRGTYYNFKNMYIVKPSYYLQTERKRKIYEYPNKKENKYYLSSIDGKIIINGERKELGHNFNKSDKRHYSLDKNKNYENNNYIQDFGFRKIDCYNKNYFIDELNKINKMLFS